MSEPAGSRGSVGTVATKFVDLPEPLELDCGQTLSALRIAYETYGTLSAQRDNAILICHALSGDAHAAGWSLESNAPSAVDGIAAQERDIAPRSGLGWWDGFIGPGKAFDTDRYFVVCTNTIGSCRGSTGPASINPATGVSYGPEFPVVTVADMVGAQRLALLELGIERLLTAAGGSLGGMQALQWTITFPDAIRSCIMTASTAALDSRGVAWNAIARNAIMADPAWQAGRYYGTGVAPSAGIGIARMVGHVTYLSDLSMEAKFGRRLQESGDYSYDLRHADFAVESYLRHQADVFGDRFDANSYLYLSRALTYFDVARQAGASLTDALAHVTAQYLLISFSSDWLYPTRDSVCLFDALRSAGKLAAHHEIESTYGHDSFLLEEEKQRPLIADFLDRLYRNA